MNKCKANVSFKFAVQRYGKTPKLPRKMRKILTCLYIFVNAALFYFSGRVAKSIKNRGENIKIVVLFFGFLFVPVECNTCGYSIIYYGDFGFHFYLFAAMRAGDSVRGAMPISKEFQEGNPQSICNANQTLQGGIAVFAQTLR